MKRFIIPGAVSLALNFICMLVNYLSYLDSNYLKFSIRTYGGEFMGEFSPGLMVSHIYGMTSEQGNSHILRLEPISLIISLLVVFGIVFLIMMIVTTLRARCA